MIEKEPIINGINYCLDDENLTAEVIKSYGRYEGGIEIPETVKVNEVSYRVTSIGMYAFAECASLTSIVIPNSITSIRKGAFESCRNLTSITIPDSVTRIGICAFKDCISLQKVTIPDSVISIGDGAFDMCISLKQDPTSKKNVINMKSEIKRQLKYFNERYEEVICSPQLKWNVKYKTPELEDYTPIIAIKDLLGNNYVVCAIPNEKVEYLLCQFNRTDKVLAEYDSLEAMVEDGWCMGT